MSTLNNNIFHPYVLTKHQQYCGSLTFNKQCHLDLPTHVLSLLLTPITSQLHSISKIDIPCFCGLICYKRHLIQIETLEKMNFNLR
jgi:hypothetical protein